MQIWSNEIKELETLYTSLKGLFPELEKELEQLIRTEDANVIMLYSRRCLEVIVTDLCECELKRPRKTEPLKGIIDKLNKEEKVPSHIITSMDHLNSLSTYGAHPKEFDPEQVKPVLNNLTTIIKWYLKYKETLAISKPKAEEVKGEIKGTDDSTQLIQKPKKRLILLLSGLLLVCVVVVVLFVFNIIGGGKQTKELEKSIAVLPFVNDSQDEENTYFINGIMEEVLNNLQTIKDLRVISRTSVEQYRNPTKSIPEIAKELDVNYIVEGSGQKYGNAFRLRVQLLVLADKERHMWGESYEQEIQETKDIFRIQSKIAEAIAAELKAVITPQEKQLIEKTPTADLAAYDAYLKGQFYWRKLTPNDLETALRYFEMAKEKDPKYALAYAGICDVWIGLQQMGIVSPAEAGPKAEAAVMKALALDSTRAEVHYTLALMKTWGMWDWKGGESAFQKAITLNPNHAEAHAYYSHFLNIVGRPEEAMEHIEIALNLDPINPLIKSLYGVDLLFVRRYDEAIKAFQDALNIEPTTPVAVSNLPQALHLTGRYNEALEEFKRRTKNSEIIEAYNHGYAKAGYAGALRLVADVQVERSKITYINPTAIASKYAMAGDKDKAIEWLEKAYQAHDPNLPYLFKPIYDSLRDDPRFQDLCRRMNLPCK